jgi:exoribonuclease R
VEVKFHIDERGFPTGIYYKENKESNQLIEEFMLLANKMVSMNPISGLVQMEWAGILASQ